MNYLGLNEFQSKKIISILKNYNSKKEELDKININYSDSLKYKEIRNYNKINKSINASYYVWGEIKQRQEITPKFFLSLRGLVNHALTSKEISKRLAEEFSTAFISDIIFEESIEKIGFDVLAESSFITSTYIIGIAALISNELELALNLHRIVERELFGIENRMPHLNKAKAAIKDIIAEELFNLTDYYFIRENNLEKALQLNNECLMYDKFHFNVLMQRTIIEFKLGNMDQAIQFNNQLKDNKRNDITWKYNRAFLLMCKGEYDDGFRDYIQLSLTNYSNEIEIVKQCIIFDKLALENNPEYEVINFILGYLYYDKLKNSAESLEYFEKFLNSNKINQYP